MMKIKKTIFALAMLILLSISFSTVVFAEELKPNPFNQDLVGKNLEGKEQKGTGSVLPGELTSVQRANPLYFINYIVRILLSFLGIGTVGLMMYAGARWMTAGGNSEQVDHAKKTLRNAVIGLVLILMAYSLTVWVAGRLQRATRSYGVGGSLNLTIGEAVERGGATPNKTAE